MEIPFNVKERPDTGLYNGKLGIWFFLASEVMLFGGLFSAYIFLRTGVDNWPAGTDYLDVPLATLNTLFLISSSVTMVMSWASLKLNDFKKYKLYTLITLLFAFGFLVIKYFEYSAKFAHNPPYLPSTNNFLGIYFNIEKSNPFPLPSISIEFKIISPIGRVDKILNISFIFKCIFELPFFL